MTRKPSSRSYASKNNGSDPRASDVVFVVSSTMHDNDTLIIGSG